MQQTRENYEFFFNTINDFLFVLDEQGNIIHTNSAVIDRLGYTREELSGLSVLMVHLTDRRVEAGHILGEMLKGITEFCPVPIVTKSGIQIPVETRVASGIWDGKPAIFGVTKDISKVKLSEEKFSKVFYLNPSVCGLSDLDTGEYVEVNDQFYSLFGFDKNEVIGKTPTDLGILTAETLNAVKLKADNNGNVTNVEANLKARNGDIKHVLLSAENIYVQDKKYRFTVVHDITELKQAQDKIRHQAGLISCLLDSIPDIIFYKDNEGVFLGCNPPFAEFVGLSRGEIVGKTDYDLFDKEIADFFRKQDKSMLEACKSKRNEEWITYPDGRKILLDTHKTPYWGPDGTLIGLIGISRDITERKHAEDEIRLKNNELLKLNFEKDKFFSIIGHDLKSPFNSIIGFSELLVEQIKNKDIEGIDEYANIILKSSNKAMDLLLNLMEWSHSQSGRMVFNPEYFDMVTCFNKITLLYDDIAGQKSITIKNILPHHASVFADNAMINTVVRNLISNAIKFTMPGGEITVSVTEKQNEIIFSVSDSGVGISKSSIEKLFRIDQCYSATGTNEETGTGLGLILCKEFVEKHNGKIWVESEERKGSTFYFTLPYNA